MVKIYSKIELSEEIKNKILASLNKATEKSYSAGDVTFLLDSTILSGIRIDIDSEILDLTLNNRLEKILDVLN